MSTFVHIQKDIYEKQSSKDFDGIQYDSNYFNWSIFCSFHYELIYVRTLMEDEL